LGLRETHIHQGLDHGRVGTDSCWWSMAEWNLNAMPTTTSSSE
jgi:hypothetical protein